MDDDHYNDYHYHVNFAEDHIKVNFKLLIKKLVLFDKIKKGKKNNL